MAGGTEITLNRCSSWSRLVFPLQTLLRVSFFFSSFPPSSTFFSFFEGEGFMTQLFQRC